MKLLFENWRKYLKEETLDKIINDVLEEVFGELEEKVDKKNMAKKALVLPESQKRARAKK